MSGAGGSYTAKDTINVNYNGIRRVNDAFASLLTRPGGRIVNMGSAGGPNFVSRCDASDPLSVKLAKPWKITGGTDELDGIATTLSQQLDSGTSYGASKALVHALTYVQAKTYDGELMINTCSPGWILTDLTQGSGASGTVEKGAIPPCWLMMDEEFVPQQPTGRYYGSDCVRSPLHVYRGPGDPPYVSDDDINKV